MAILILICHQEGCLLARPMPIQMLISAAGAMPLTTGASDGSASFCIALPLLEYTGDSVVHPLHRNHLKYYGYDLPYALVYNDTPMINASCQTFYTRTLEISIETIYLSSHMAVLYHLSLDYRSMPTHIVLVFQ